MKIMVTVTIPKKEYQKLIDKSFRYEYLRQIIEEDIFASPPLRDIKKIIREFRKTNLYNENFLRSLEQGLRHSSYFQK